MTALRAFTTWIVAASSVSLLSACDTGEEPPPANVAPTAQIVSGVVEGGPTPYNARIGWTGHDPDGYVARFEYALDPPGAFTREEIAEGGEGIEITELPGENGEPDRTRVSKIVGGETVSFDWVHTLLTSKRFVLSTRIPEPLGPGAEPPWAWYGGHVLYLRAVDDDLAPSVPDRAVITARSFAPDTRIVKPGIQKTLSIVGPRLPVRWDADDLDSPKPAGYYYKLLRLDTYGDLDILFLSPDVLFTRGGEWTYQDADTPGVTLDLDLYGYYAFGVRAVDEAGATDPFVEWDRNAFRFEALPAPGFPSLVVYEPGLGRFPHDSTSVFQDRGEADVEAVENRPLHFSWTGTAEAYGGTIAAYAYGVDVSGPLDEGPDSGWSDWGGMTSTPEPVVYETTGPHTFSVRVRDEEWGTITVATIHLGIFTFTFDREILFVEDSLDETYPNDADHDAFWADRFASYGVSPDVFSAHGAGDRESFDPQAPSLEELGRYRLVVWECRGSGYDGQCALLRSTALEPRLQTYLAAGGMLWLGGRMTVGATIYNPETMTGNFQYPKDLTRDGTGFAYRFLKLRTTGLALATGDGKNGLLAVLPTDPAIYSRMDRDSTKLSPLVQQLGVGIFDCEAMLDSLSIPHLPEGELEPLYLYRAVGDPIPTHDSLLQNKLCALRWHDPDPDRQQGAIQWFGFPLYYFRNSQAQETLNRSLDWFRDRAP